MAIAFQNATSMATANGGPVWQDNYTTPSVANGIMIVALLVSSGSRTGITYAGQPMTLLGTSAIVPVGGSSLQVWYLASPASGSNQIALTGTGVQFYAISVYSGVSQSAPINASASSTQTGGTSFSSSVTSTVASTWTLGLISSNGATLTAGTGTTQRTDLSGSQGKWFDSNGTVAAGSNSLSVTASASNYAAVMIALAPVPAATNGAFLINFI